MAIKFNKKGDAGDWVNFGGFFLIMFIIVIGLLIGFYSFFGRGYDIRQADADVLFLQARDCLEEKDFFVQDFIFNESCKFFVDSFDGR